MVFVHSCKIFISRFGLLWGILIYLIMAMLILTGISLPFVLLLRQGLSNSGILIGIQNVFSAIVSGKDINIVYDSIDALFVNIYKYFEVSPVGFIGSTIFYGVLFLFVIRFFVGMQQFPLASIIDKYVSANAIVGLGGVFFSDIRQSFKFVLVRMVFSIIFDICLIALIALLLYLVRSAGAEYSAAFLTMLLFIIMVSLRSTLSACWTGEAINNNSSSILGSFRRGTAISCRSFFKVYGTYFLVWLLVMLVNIFVASYTFGVGLIITLPLAVLFMSIVSIVMYYNLTCKRYYVDNIVVCPTGCVVSDVVEGSDIAHSNIDKDVDIPNININNDIKDSLAIIADDSDISKSNINNSNDNDINSNNNDINDPKYS